MAHQMSLMGEGNVSLGTQQAQSTKKERIKNDFYPTEAGVTHVLADYCITYDLIDGSMSVFEPCAGEMAIVDALTSRFLQHQLNPTLLASDLTWDIGQETDATLPEFWELWREHNLSWIITNPPFNQAEQILPLAFDSVDRGMAILLRASYSEPSGGRADWLKQTSDHLRAVIWLNPRPIFRADTKKTDSVTAAWYVWDKAWSWRSLGIPCPFLYATEWRNTE